MRLIASIVVLGLIGASGLTGSGNSPANVTSGRSSNGTTKTEVLKGAGDGARILFWMPTAAKSMQMSAMQFVNALCDRGHRVTMVVPFKERLERDKLEIIKAESAYQDIWVKYSSDVLKDGIKRAPPFGDILIEALNASDNVLSDPQFKRLLDETFDVVMVKMYVASEVGYYLSHHFNASLVLYTTVMASFSPMDHAMGMPHNTAYLPYVMTEMGIMTQMTFMERVKNTLMTNMMEYAGRNWHVFDKVDALLDKHFGSAPRPTLLEMENNAAVAIHSGHPLLMDGMRPVAPNFVYVGMMVCDEKFAPLNGELRRFIEGAEEHGVVLVSFGSGPVMNSQMSDENLAQFMSAFARLKERVVWKWEAGDRDLKALGLSDNVYVSSWLPQHAVVAHPNVRAAVIHGGIRSMQEMLCYGKPQVTVPVFGDQPANGLYAKSRGYGEMVPFATLDEEELFTAIRNVIDDPKFAATAKKYGDLISDQETRPLERAIWWIEHAIRHPDLATHYRSPVHDLPWYQFYLLDVFCFLIVVTAAIMVMAVAIACFLLRRAFRQQGLAKNKNE